MTSTHPNARLEEWLRHEGFLRKTLRGLLASEADVDDALQQTWTKLLERPVGVPAEPRGWLTRVARNVALGGMRARRRRSEHEAGAVARTQGESPAESAARVEALQRVGAAILALAEPYRSVVLLRHEQELDVATIARRLGRSEATVRSQLSRAHELLRHRLDREFGGRERWAALAAPLASAAAAWLVPGAAALLLLAAVGTYAVWPEAEPPAVEIASAPAAELRTAPGAGTPAVAAEEQPADPQREPARTAPARVPAPATPVEILLQGRVGETGGNPHRVHPDGKLEYFRERVAEPLALDLPIEAREARAHVTAASLPPDQVLHVRRAEFSARFEGLSHARERYAIVLGTTELVLAPHAHEGFVGTWEGDLVLDEAELKRSYLGLGSSSAGAVRLQGELEPKADWEERRTREGLARVTSAVPLPLRYPVLRAPRARLQVRAGHQGGNPLQIGLAGKTSIYVLGCAPSALDLEPPPGDREGLVHFEGGHVPSGMAFVVTQASWESTTYRHGPVTPLRLVVADQELADLAPAFPPGSRPGTPTGDGEPGGAATGDQPGEPGWPGDGYTEDSERTPVGVRVSGSWAGRLVVLPGKEERTYLEASYFTNAEAWLSGELVPLDSLTPEERSGFARKPALPPIAPVAPVAPKPEPPPPPELTRPRVVLQARAGHGGGNPVTIALNGKTSNHVDRVETLPLDFTATPTGADPELVYGETGRIPAGQVLVITRATWWSVTCDESSHSRFRLKVAGKLLAARKGKGDPESGSWSGRLLVRPGQEESTSLEVGYFAMADVLLVGHFEPLEK